mmetsp:Transcript_100023/g.311656  ORF Transcript_100023/g.311656 Transcript_100023/m.311656 type:complete len:201 (-) Transcript_100023:813-1415(-)
MQEGCFLETVAGTASSALALPSAFPPSAPSAPASGSAKTSTTVGSPRRRRKPAFARCIRLCTLSCSRLKCTGNLTRSLGPTSNQPPASFSPLPSALTSAAGSPLPAPTAAAVESSSSSAILLSCASSSSRWTTSGKMLSSQAIGPLSAGGSSASAAQRKLRRDPSCSLLLRAAGFLSPRHASSPNPGVSPHVLANFRRHE